MVSNSLKRWPQWLWCTDIWCIHTYTLHNIKCTCTLSVGFEVVAMYVFLFYGPPCHIILLISSHLVAKINYFCAVSSSTTHFLLNCLALIWASTVFEVYSKFFIPPLLSDYWENFNVVFASSLMKYLFIFPILPS